MATTCQLKQLVRMMAIQARKRAVAEEKQASGASANIAVQTEQCTASTARRAKRYSAKRGSAATSSAATSSAATNSAAAKRKKPSATRGVYIYIYVYRYIYI
jgi:hypothetical protein